MKKKLITLLTLRIKEEITSREDLAVLKDYEVAVYINQAVVAIYNLTKNDDEKVNLALIASAVGRKVMIKLKIKKDSGLAVRIGCFILYSFEQLRIIQLVYGTSAYKHAAYAIKILDQDALDHLWLGAASVKNGVLPSCNQHPDWISTNCESGLRLIKTNSEFMLKEVTPERCPLLFNGLNKMQSTAYKVNREVLAIAEWAFKGEEVAFAEIWEEVSSEAQVSKRRDTKTIFTIANKVKYFPFFHQFQVDFRSRCYATTGYFSSQGTDLAKGCILRDDSREITEKGHIWLLIAISNLWAGDSGDGRKTDKLPLSERAKWTVLNADWILACADAPKEQKRWMGADKPWSFLAAIFELRNFRAEGATYKSHLEVYIDGTVNGIQHLAALTRDHQVGPLVNLTKQAQVGDLYAHMAKKVWHRVNLHYRNLTSMQQERCETFIREATALRKRIVEVEEYSEEYKQLVEKLINVRNSYATIVRVSWVAFWRKVTDAKQRRKVIKRNCMTLALDY